MNQVRGFIEWLAFHPTNPEITRALVTGYLAPFGAKAARFGRIHGDDSAEVLSQYGYDLDVVGKIFPSKEWRNNKSEEALLILSPSNLHWAPSSKLYVSTLRDHGVLQGHLVIEFNEPVSEKDKPQVAEAIEDLSVPISLYLSFQKRGVSNLTVETVSDTRDAGAIQLTQRQILILRGMVEGKTNHELATEMGFSVSTIRHETMRIYQELAVSDRKEAAKKALVLSII